MLDFQIVQAPLRFGLAEGVEPHQVPFGTLTKAENACWSKTGLLEKRPGTQALATSIVGGGSITAANRLLVRGTELSLIDGSHLYTQTASGWIDRGIVPNVGLTWTTSHAGLSTVKAADFAIVGTTLVEVWEQGDIGGSGGSNDEILYQIRDLTTGAIITPPTFVSSSTAADHHIRLLTDGTLWWVVFSSGSSGNVYVYSAGSGSHVVATGGATSSTRSLDAIMAGSDIIVAYAQQAGGIGLLRVNSSTFAVSATGSVTGETSTGVISIGIAGAAGEPLYIGYITSAKVRYSSANISTLAQTLAPTDLATTTTGYIYSDSATMAAARYSATQCYLAYSYARTEDGPVTFATKYLNASGSGGAGPATWNICPLTKPVQINGRWLIAAANVTGWAKFSGTTGVWPASDTMVLDITPEVVADAPRQVGKIECLTGAFWGGGYASTVIVDSAGVYRVATPCALAAAQDLRTTGTVNHPLTGVRHVQMTPGGGTDMWRSLDLKRESYFCAGTMLAYDGLESVGYGWPFGPLIQKATTSTTGGTIAAGSYLYNVVAERVGSSGVLHRSPIGPAVKATTSGTTSSVTLALMVSSAGHARINPGAFVFYRTVVNGLVEQRLGSPPGFMSLPDDFSISIGALVVPPTVTDTSSDAAAFVSTQPALYTEGGELEDMQPTAPQTLAYHQSRIWMVDGSGTTVWFSKDRSSNPDVAPGFHPTQILTFDRTVTALATLDDKLIAFAADTLWVILGDGPAPNGQGGSYQISPVQTDVGCINPRSVVSTPNGIMFQSSRGIYLLTRALELNWIGRPIRDELASYPTITSAVLVAGRNEVRFTASNGSASVVLVYNYVEGQWTTSKYTIGGVYGADIADACMWQGKWTAVTKTGTVIYETTANALDTDASSVASWVPLSIESAWVNAQGPLSFQSVRNFSFEGVAKTAHSFTIDVGFDSDPSYPQTKTFAVSTLGAGSYLISIGTRRKCHAIRFRLTDAAPAVMGGNTGEGMSLSVLGIEVGMKRGFPKKPAQNTG